MHYEIEELLPVVGWLAKKYTAGESTSMTYEKAEQLMGAVLYCIQEAEQQGENVVVAGKVEVEKMYHIGVKAVEDKTKLALDIYHQIVEGFDSYENRCLYDTMIEGIPEFFKWYDVRFAPQETILTLDYPVLKDLTGITGIDCVYEWLVCVYIEQRFLGIFPREDVIRTFVKYDEGYRESIQNLPEMMMLDLVGHILAGKALTERRFSMEDYRKIYWVMENRAFDDINKQVFSALEFFIQKGGENETELLDYLWNGVQEIFVRVQFAVQNHVLDTLFV